MRLGIWNGVKVGGCTCDEGARNYGLRRVEVFPQGHLQTAAGSARIACETWEQQNRNTLLSITKWIKAGLCRVIGHVLIDKPQKN